MIDILISILHKEVYLFGLLAAFIIGGILKQEHYLNSFYAFINAKLKNKKAALAIVSSLCGIFPIEGRCTVSAPFLDGLCGSKNRSKLGIIDYIATHHYYLWSPLEPSVLIFLSVLGITWFSFIQTTALMLGVYILFLILLLVFYVKDEDIHIELTAPTNPKSKKHTTTIVGLLVGCFALMIFQSTMFPFYITFPVLATIMAIMTKTPISTIFSFINWKLLVGIAGIIAMGTVAKTYYVLFSEYIIASDFDIIKLLFVGMGMAIVLGSSSKYAGIGALIVNLTSITFLPVVLACEFVGYLVSPTHKCLGISKMYFGTNTKQFAVTLGLLSVLLILSSLVTYYIFV